MIVESQPSTKRLTRLRQELEQEGIDALLVSNGSNRRYLSGFTGSAGYLLVTRDDAVIATDFRYYEQSAAQAPEFRLYKTVAGLDRWLPGLLEGLGGKRIGFEAADVSYALHRQILSIVDQLARRGATYDHADERHCGTLARQKGSGRARASAGGHRSGRCRF